MEEKNERERTKEGEEAKEGVLLIIRSFGFREEGTAPKSLVELPPVRH
jgi:hypothetical protein